MAKDIGTAPGIGTDSDYLNSNKIDQNLTLCGEIINQDLVQIWQKLMDDASITPNGDFDNETNGYQFKIALEFFQRAQQALNTKNITEIYSQNATPIALDGTNTIVYPNGFGTVIEVTSTSSFKILDSIFNSAGTTRGERVYVHFTGTENVTINHGTGSANIETPDGVSVVATQGTIVEFVTNPDTGGNFTWRIMSSSKPLLPVWIQLGATTVWYRRFNGNLEVKTTGLTGSGVLGALPVGYRPNSFVAIRGVETLTTVFTDISISASTGNITTTTQSNFAASIPL
jgi:hypothetical protein